MNMAAIARTLGPFEVLRPNLFPHQDATRGRIDDASVEVIDYSWQFQISVTLYR